MGRSSFSGGGDSRPYKSYAALLTQSGTDAPVAEILENTFGETVVWSRFGSGVYKGTILSDLFSEGKTVVLIKGNPISNFNLIFIADYEGGNEITVQSTEGDETLTNQFIEIRVYN